MELVPTASPYNSLHFGQRGKVPSPGHSVYASHRCFSVRIHCLPVAYSIPASNFGASCYNQQFEALFPHSRLAGVRSAAV